MRRKRNYLIYGIGLAVSGIEADNAVNTAEEFVKIVKKFIKGKNSQAELL